MSLARKDVLISPDDYLAGEIASPVKHEYVAGTVYAMAGATSQHNEVVGNVFAALHAQLRGKPCRPYNSDTKVRLRLRNEVRFYYPDVQVTCHPNAPVDAFQDSPAVVVEVLSDGTRRVDGGEKRDAYLSIPSLSYYLLAESDEALIVVYRRTETGFVRESHAGRDAVIPLAAIGVSLRLADVYDRVTTSP